MLISSRNTLTLTQNVWPNMWALHVLARAIHKILHHMNVLQSRGAIVVFQSLSPVQCFATQWTAAYQASLFFTISRRLFKLMSTHVDHSCPDGDFRIYNTSWLNAEHQYWETGGWGSGLEHEWLLSHFLWSFPTDSPVGWLWRGRNWRERTQQMIILIAQLIILQLQAFLPTLAN